MQCPVASQLAQLQADKERMKQRLDEAAERRLGLR